MTRILVVDDSPVTRLLCSHVLHEANYQVLTANDGLEAWSSLQHNDIQLLISDVAMPEMDGLTLLKRLRTARELKHIPVILLTGTGEDEQELATMGIDADCIMSKPVSSWELVDVATRLLEHSV